MTTEMNEQSLRMSAYNYARWFGRKTGQFDVKRVDKALGYLMSGKCDIKWYEYETTLNHCNCPDATGCLIKDNGEMVTWPPNPNCKHKIALMIQTKIDRLRKENGR